MSNGHMALVMNQHDFDCDNGCKATGRGFVAPHGWFQVDIKGAYEYRGGPWRGHRGMLFCSWQCVQEGISNLSKPNGGRQKSRGKEEDTMVIHKRTSAGWGNEDGAKCDTTITDRDRLHMRWASVTCKRCLKSAPVAVTA